MNQLFIIGNGFDLAHGLPTRYEDFLLWYFKKSHEIWTLTGEFKDESTSFKPKIRVKEPPLFLKENLDEYKNLIGDIITIPNPILRKIMNSQTTNWASVEYQYLECLREVLKGDSITNLNNGLAHLKSLLTTYLLDVVEPLILDKGPIPQFEHNFNLKPSSTTEGNPTYRVILNFNYTSTFNKLYSFPQSMYHQNLHIHGELNNSSNPIIFGFGDDYFDEYRTLENKNEPAYLENIKAMSYAKSSSYNSLQQFLDLKSLFEVTIIGHSCGISDRTLLKRIFQSAHCRHIRYNHYPEVNDFFYRTIEISRHFDDNGEMNRKLHPFDPSSVCPQFDK